MFKNPLRQLVLGAFNGLWFDWLFNLNVSTRIATSAAVAVVIPAFGLAGEVVLFIVLFRPGCL